MSEQGPDLQLSPGDIIFMSAHSVANPGFVAPASDSSFEDDAMQTFEDCFGTEPGELAAPGFPTADSILVLSVEQDLTFIGVRLGVMSTDPVANHLPELADKLTKPKVFFIGGENQPVVLGVCEGRTVGIDDHDLGRRNIIGQQRGHGSGALGAISDNDGVVTQLLSPVLDLESTAGLIRQHGQGRANQ